LRLKNTPQLAVVGIFYFFKQNAQLIYEDDEETHYFDCKEDLRIQRNNSFAKIWLKKGKMHDKYREEIPDIKFDRCDFDNLEKLFIDLGYQVEIKWFRRRFAFKWEDITVCLDYTKGYGYIIELEKMTSEEDKKREYETLEQKLKSLNVEITPKEEFDRRFLYYKENWRSLIDN